MSSSDDLYDNNNLQQLQQQQQKQIRLCLHESKHPEYINLNEGRVLTCFITLLLINAYS